MVVTLPATRPSISSVGKGERRLRPAVAAGTGPAWANAVVVPASLLAITASWMVRPASDARTR